jgi:GT2 family glycosyltransferase
MKQIGRNTKMSKVKKIIKVSLKTMAHPRHARETLRFARSKQRINKARREDYISWFSGQILTEKQLDKQRELAKKLKNKPLISVLMPTYNTNPQHLQECIESVIHQTYTNWELCISDDASTNNETKSVIKKYVKKHKNIKAIFNKVNGHIAVATNIALDMANGEYISLLDNDDLLLPNALYETVLMINKNPDADLIYSDEDKLEDDSIHVEPHFKPDWSPDFLNSCNYITHFATIRHSVMKKVKGFTPGSQGAQDWDLFLRISQVTDKIYHIPRILYTWRKSETSTAQSANSKPYAYINQKKILRHYLADKQVNASVEGHPSMGFWRVKYGILGTPLISIVIPTKNCRKLIDQCVDSILVKTSYPYFEIVIVDTGSNDPDIQKYYNQVTKSNPEIKVVNWVKDKFNFSSSCNFGAKHAKGDYFLFLNNDTEVISHDWLQSLLEHAQRDYVGAVGAKLLFSTGKIQHAGVVVCKRDVAFHPFYGEDPRLDIFNNIYISNIRNTAAVTAACMMVSRKKFEEVGGFDVKLRVTYNDVDLCLKLLDAGYKNVYNPFAELFHHESMSIGKITGSSRDMKEFEEAKLLMQKRWSKYLENDPYYNANFTQFGPGYKLDS